MKRFWSLILTLILIFNFTTLSFSYADTIEDINNVDFNSSYTIDSTNPDEENSFWEDYVEEPFSNGLGIFSMIITFITDIATWLVKLLAGLVLLMPTIEGCILNSQNWFRLSFFDANPAGLAGSIQGVIAALYNALRYLVTASYIIILVYLGIRMLLSSIGRQKAHYKELFKHWLVGLLLLFSFHWVMAFAIWLCNTFVEILAGFVSGMINVQDSISGVSALGTVYKDQIVANPITAHILNSITSPILSASGLTLVLLLVLFGFVLVISFTYLKRLFTIALLILLFPLVALSYVFDKIGDRKAQTLNYWLKEFTVNVMIQPIHAVTLLLIAAIYSASINNPGLSLFTSQVPIGGILTVLVLLLIPTGEKLLKQLFQISSHMGPASGGFGRSFAQAGLALKGAKEVGGSLKKIGTNAKTAFTLQNGYDFKKARENAENARKQAQKNLKGIKRIQAGNAAYKNSLKSDPKYKDYLKNLEEKTGSKSAAEAKAKAITSIAFGSIGIGTALGSSDTISSFAPNAATQAALGATVGSGLVGSVFALSPKNPNDYASRYKELRSVENFNNISDEKKKKIAAELGIDVKMINNANKENILEHYANLERYARYTGNMPNKEMVRTLSPTATAVDNIKKGYMPEGNEPLDKTQFKYTQTKDALIVEEIVEEKETGKSYYLEGLGNEKLRKDESVEVDSFETTTKEKFASGEAIDKNPRVINSTKEIKKHRNDIVKHLRENGISEDNIERIEKLPIDNLFATSLKEEVKKLFTNSIPRDIENIMFEIPSDIKHLRDARNSAKESLNDNYDAIENAVKKLSTQAPTYTQNASNSYAQGSNATYENANYQASNLGSSFSNYQTPEYPSYSQPTSFSTGYTGNNDFNFNARPSPTTQVIDNALSEKAFYYGTIPELEEFLNNNAKVGNTFNISLSPDETRFHIQWENGSKDIDVIGVGSTSFSELNVRNLTITYNGSIWVIQNK